MIFNLSIAAVILASLVLVLQLGNANHHSEAEFVVRVAAASTAFLFSSRFILSEKRKFGWQACSIALVPLCLYLFLGFVLNGTGGLGAPD